MRHRVGLQRELNRAEALACVVYGVDANRSRAVGAIGDAHEAKARGMGGR